MSQDGGPPRQPRRRDHESPTSTYFDEAYEDTIRAFRTPTPVSSHRLRTPEPQPTGYLPTAPQTFGPALAASGGQAEGSQYPSHGAAMPSGQAPFQSAYNTPTFDTSLTPPTVGSGDGTTSRYPPPSQPSGSTQSSRHRNPSSHHLHQHRQSPYPLVPIDRNNWTREDERLTGLARDLKPWSYINGQFHDPPAAAEHWHNVLKAQHPDIEAARVRADV